MAHLPLVPHLNSPLARRLLITVLELYLAIAMSLTLLQLVLEYDHEQTRLEQEINHANLTFEPLLGSAIWRFDDAQLMETMNSLLLSSSIIGAKVGDTQGQELVSMGTVINNEGMTVSHGNNDKPSSSYWLSFTAHKK
jgi:hypothetical protein